MNIKFGISHIFQVRCAVIFFGCFIILCGCTKSNLKKQEQIAQMTDVQLLQYYHGLGERIKIIEMEYRIDRELDPTNSEHRILQDQAIGGKVYRLEQTRKMILKELKKRNIEP